MNRSGHNPTRRGFALMMAMGVLAFVGAMVPVMLTVMSNGRKVQHRACARAQTAWLVEAGLERAAVRLADDGRYRGETWNLAGDELGLTVAEGNAAVITVEVETPAGSNTARRVRVVAEFSPSPAMRVRDQKTLMLLNFALRMNPQSGANRRDRRAPVGPPGALAAQGSIGAGNGAEANNRGDP